eukprot:CAMPEP_0168459746 /NCGR_PEP_ID=MMETSP0228-20121227/53083_1 /TAXON_ID=133427 /ORGANISM="Protoceratium reticulatum, Strain CCCM 535 (=CCMP 1889)" /LENGTH=63 /DNA_ID=CAMNT_0008474949 /DNA_START=36 /DNA_END=223 /DNA_ORIENTATION=+
MATTKHPRCIVLILAAACVCMQVLRSLCFVPAPSAASVQQVAAVHFSPAVAASAALPALTMLS